MVTVKYPGEKSGKEFYDSHKALTHFEQDTCFFFLLG